MGLVRELCSCDILSFNFDVDYPLGNMFVVVDILSVDCDVDCPLTCCGSDIMSTEHR